MTGSAEVVREYIDESFDVNVPVRVLHWREDGERLWELPRGLCVTGSAPTHLGVVLRRDAEGFTVRIQWDQTQLSWRGLTKVEVLCSCLSPLLSALGLDLWSMLELPALRLRTRAA